MTPGRACDSHKRSEARVRGMYWPAVARPGDRRRSPVREAVLLSLGCSSNLSLKVKALKVKALKGKATGRRSALFTDARNSEWAVLPAPVKWDFSVDKRSGEHLNRARVSDGHHLGPTRHRRHRSAWSGGAWSGRWNIRTNPL